MRSRAVQECALCQGTGWRAVERAGVRAVETCSCQSPRRDAAWWAGRAGIPPRFRECDFASFQVPDNNSSLQMALIKARGFAEQYPLVEKGLLFIGGPGVGKTHLAVAVLKELMTRKGMDCLFCPFAEMLQQVQESFDSESAKSKGEVLQPVLQTDVVVIDDLGGRRVTDWVEDTFAYILNHRYNHQKATLLTTDLPDSLDEVPERSPSGKFAVGDTLTQRLGPRVRSRLHEMCETVPIAAADFRQRGQGAKSDRLVITK